MGGVAVPRCGGHQTTQKQSDRRLWQNNEKGAKRAFPLFVLIHTTPHDPPHTHSSFPLVLSFFLSFLYTKLGSWRLDSHHNHITSALSCPGLSPSLPPRSIAFIALVGCPSSRLVSSVPPRPSVWSVSLATFPIPRLQTHTPSSQTQPPPPPNQTRPINQSINHLKLQHGSQDPPGARR